MHESEQVTRNNTREEAVDLPLSKAAGPASAARHDGIFINYGGKIKSKNSLSRRRKFKSLFNNIIVVINAAQVYFFIAGDSFMSLVRKLHRFLLNALIRDKKLKKEMISL